jgi:hypothetical protein
MKRNKADESPLRKGTKGTREEIEETRSKFVQAMQAIGWAVSQVSHSAYKFGHVNKEYNREKKKKITEKSET